jgi:hypothetical protein
VISDASSTLVSPSPTVPEFSNQTLILIVITMVAVTICTVSLALKKSTRTISNYKLGNNVSANPKITILGTNRRTKNKAPPCKNETCKKYYSLPVNFVREIQLLN